MKFDKTLKMINNSKRLVERKLSAHLWLQIMAIRRCTSSPTLISIQSQARLPSRWQLVTRFLFLSTSSKPISWKLLMKISQCSLSKFKGGRLWFHPNSAWEMEFLRRSKTVLRTCDSCSTRSNKHLKKSFNKFFNHFKQLMVKGFMALRAHAEEIISFVEMSIVSGIDLPCF